MPNIVAKIISPSQMVAVGDQNVVWMEAYSRKCLAQGDSWFSIGAIPPWATTNLPDQFVFSNSMVIVNCATPGRELAHMTDTTLDQAFLRLLHGKLSYKWDAIFLSGGGNDMIDALMSVPTNGIDQRLLRVASEWGASEQGVLRYVSEDGWSAFASHMNEVVDVFLAERDRGQNATTPVFFHTYDYPMPRNAPAFPGCGPWLYTALKDMYQIPEADWLQLSDELFGRLARLLVDQATARATRGLYVVNTTNTIARAQPGTQTQSGDWENEIHPDANGYSLLAQKWRHVVEPVLWP